MVLVLWRLRNSLINSITRKKTRWWWRWKTKKKKYFKCFSWSSIDLQEIKKIVSLLARISRNHYHWLEIGALVFVCAFAFSKNTWITKGHERFGWLKVEDRQKTRLKKVFFVSSRTVSSLRADQNDYRCRTMMLLDLMNRVLGIRNELKSIDYAFLFVSSHFLSRISKRILS